MAFFGGDPGFDEFLFVTEGVGFLWGYHWFEGRRELLSLVVFFKN